MRQRRIKNLEEKIKPLQYLLVKEVAEDGSLCLKEAFEKNKKPLCLEIGCGKGKFISELAASRPDVNFVAIEAQSSVIYYALSKADEKKLDNVKFIYKHLTDDDLTKMTTENEISGLYLNFSDPWPKSKHAKRRLTYYKKFLIYSRLIENNGFINIKTDNDDLFNFTIEEVEHANEILKDENIYLKIETLERDLHNSIYNDGNITTEYEDKFASREKNINFLRIEVVK